MRFERFITVRNRFAVYCAIFILYFILVMCFGTGIVPICFAVLHIVSALVLFAVKKLRSLRFLAFALLFSACGMILACAAKGRYYEPAEKFLADFGGENGILTVRIDGIESAGDTYACYNCSILEFDGTDTKATYGAMPSLRLNRFGAEMLGKGDVISFYASVSKPEEYTEDGYFEAENLRSRHIFAVCDYSGDTELIEKGKPAIHDRLRKAMSDGLTRFVKGTDGEAQIAKSMLLGDRTGVPYRLKKVFRAAGISHIFSVSGLHLSILFGVFAFFCGKTGSFERRRFVFPELISSLLVFLYMAAAGFTASVMRAGFMIIFINIWLSVQYFRVKMRKSDEFLCGENADEKDRQAGAGSDRFAVTDALTALFFAGTLIIILSPYSVFDVGMQLSFMSNFGILAGLPFTDSICKKVKIRFFGWVFSCLFITLSAVSFTLPVCVHNFGTVSTVSVITNLLVAPVVCPLLVMLLLLAILTFASGIGLVSGMCTGLGYLCGLLCKYCIAVSEFTSGGRFSVIPVYESTVLTVVFTVFALFTLVCFLNEYEKLRTAGFFSVIWLYIFVVSICFFINFGRFYGVRFSLCTVNQRPYFCVFYGGKRIFFDNMSGTASDVTLRRTFGGQLYDTENIYAVVPSDYSDFGDAYFNITYLDKSKKIDTVFVPSEECILNVGADRDGYTDFVKRLSDGGFDVRFYTDGFSVGTLDITADMTSEVQLFGVGNTAVAFSKSYDSSKAQELSAKYDVCFYFCRKTAGNREDVYNGEGIVYVPSGVHKRVDGTFPIPVRKPYLFSVSEGKEVEVMAVKIEK